MQNKKDFDKNHRMLTLLTWAFIFLVWFIITRFNLVSSLIVPSPGEVVQTFFAIIKDGYNGISLWEHLGISLFRLFIASVLAIVTAVPLGLFSGYFSKFGAIVDSVVQFYRPLPPLAYYVVLILWLGIDESSKITLLYLAAFAPIYIACVSAVSNIGLSICSVPSLWEPAVRICFFRSFFRPVCRIFSPAFGRRWG
jgi:taurine transport system permease protein